MLQINIFGTSEGANNAINKGDSLYPSLAIPSEQMIYHLAHYMALPHQLGTLIQYN
jgi:hypothetical protein